MSACITISFDHQDKIMTEFAPPAREIRSDYGLLSFEELFKTHFRELHAYAFTLVREEMLAEEMVQQVFVKLWEKRNSLQINHSGTAYLYKSVYHECLNYLKHQKVRASYQQYLKSAGESPGISATQKIQLSELQEHLNRALGELPEQCRTIFQMSRFEELKYQEIANRLQLSVKTVENQMGKALKLLREKLKDFLPLLLILLNP